MSWPRGRRGNHRRRLDDIPADDGPSSCPVFDAHVHLHDERLDGCRDEVLAAAAAAGVTAACCCGGSPADWEALARLAARPSPLHLLPAYGVHPWHVGDLPPDWLERLEQRLLADPRAAVGEIGVDGVHRDVPGDLQRVVLRAQLELAARLRRPVVLHGARAWGALCEALAPHAARLPAFMAHAFAGSAEILGRLVGWGGYVSFAGTVCNPAARRVRAAAACVPPAHLLAETDTPDLLPAGGASAGHDPAARLNQPANLPLVTAALAEVRGAAPAGIATLTDANARRLLAGVAAC
jgi:TatD DNase family protein